MVALPFVDDTAAKLAGFNGALNTVKDYITRSKVLGGEIGKRNYGAVYESSIFWTQITSKSYDHFYFSGTLQILMIG